MMAFTHTAANYGKLVYFVVVAPRFPATSEAVGCRLGGSGIISLVHGDDEICDDEKRIRARKSFVC